MTSERQLAHLARARAARTPEGFRRAASAGGAAAAAKLREQGPTDAQRAAAKANGERVAALNRTPERRERMREAWRNRPVIGECYACWGPATELDHLLAPRRGGSDDPVNRVPLCHPCNASKSARTWDEWLEAGLRGAGPAVIP